MKNSIKFKGKSYSPRKEKMLEVLEKVLLAYSSPSFGSLSKRDADVLMFSVLQDLDIVKTNPQIFDVVQQLHITRAKARNLIYESALRRLDEQKVNDELKMELKRVIVKPLFLKDVDKICIEIDNPLLIDYIRRELRNLNHITDGSFSPELVKMTPDAYIDLYKSLLQDFRIKEIEKKLVKLGLKKDKSPGALLTRVIKIICKGALGKVGADLVDVSKEIYENLSDWLEGSYDRIPVNWNDAKNTIFEMLNIDKKNI